MNKLKYVTILFALCGMSACEDRGGDPSFEANDKNPSEDPFANNSETFEIVNIDRTTPPNFKRDFSRSVILSKLENITIPSIEIGGGIPLITAISLIQSKSSELDYYETDPFQRGIHFDVWDSRRVKGTKYYGRELSPYLSLSMPHDDERWMAEPKFAAVSINLGDLISELAAMSNLDVYITSQGVALVPEGQDPNPTERKDVTIWQSFQSN